MRTAQSLLVVLSVSVAAIVSGTTLVAATTDDAEPAIGSFAALTAPGATNEDAELTDLARYVGATPDEAAGMRVLRDGLGPFDSRLIAFTAKSGRTICYALLAAKATDPGASYCYQPRGTLPSGLAGQHFDLIAPQYARGGQLAVQVFGIAFDDVVSMRIDVGGVWHSVPVENNAFYLYLPGVGGRDLGNVEAVLASGAIQRDDIRTGR